MFFYFIIIFLNFVSHHERYVTHTSRVTRVSYTRVTGGFTPMTCGCGDSVSPMVIHRANPTQKKTFLISSGIALRLSKLLYTAFDDDDRQVTPLSSTFRVEIRITGIRDVWQWRSPMYHKTFELTRSDACNFHTKVCLGLGHLPSLYYTQRHNGIRYSVL